MTPGIIIYVLMLLTLAGCGWFIVRTKRLQLEQAAQERRDKYDAYLEEQRQRMKANTAVFMKEIEQITKIRHPDSTRHQRKTVAACFRKHVKSS